MNHRAVILTPEERVAKSLAYYYRNRETILARLKLKRELARKARIGGGL